MSKQKSTEKKLTQKEQLEQDIVKFDQQIESVSNQLRKSEEVTVNLRNQLHQLIGAKTYAQVVLKQGESNALCEKGKNNLQESKRVEKEGDSEK